MSKENFLFLIIIFLNISIENSPIEKESNITLKLKSGNNKIYNSVTPSEIYIKGKNVEISNYHQFDDEVTTVILVYSTSIRSCLDMFNGCESIIEMDLTNFDTSNVNNMGDMFMNCKSLKKLSLNNLNTASVTTMANMFCDCISLISLDLSSFDTSKVENMGHMFYNCEYLTKIDLSNFVTTKVLYMDYLFHGCKNLSSINISSFITSTVNNMASMFQDCISLISLDIPNLDTSSITEDNNLNNIFSNCKNLEYINLRNYKYNPGKQFQNSHFDDLIKNFVI
jgi:surface protein